MKKVKSFLNKIKIEFQDNLPVIVTGFILWILIMILYKVADQHFEWEGKFDLLTGFILGFIFDDVAKALKSKFKKITEEE